MVVHLPEILTEIPQSTSRLQRTVSTMNNVERAEVVEKVIWQLDM